VLFALLAQPIDHYTGIAFKVQDPTDFFPDLIYKSLIFNKNARAGEYLTTDPRGRKGSENGSTTLSFCKKKKKIHKHNKHRVTN
jgi:hypothetical protein